MVTRRSPEAYLKHVVSSPEAFRHGYLVVAILFSEQTSLRNKLEKEHRGFSAGEQRPVSAKESLALCRSASSSAEQVPERGRAAD